MKKTVKSFVVLLISFIFIIFNLMYSYADDINKLDGEYKDLVEDFNETILSLKNGNFKDAYNSIYINDALIDALKDVLKEVPLAETIINKAKPIKEKLKDVTIKEQLQGLTKKVMEPYEFKVLNVEKDGKNEYIATITINMPNDSFYEDLSKKYNQFNSSKVGKISNFIGTILNMGVGVSGQFYKQGSKLTVDLSVFNSIASNDYEKKVIERKARLVDDNGKFKLDITNFLPMHINDYIKNNKDNENLYTYLFLPLWNIMEDYYITD